MLRYVCRRRERHERRENGDGYFYDNRGRSGNRIFPLPVFHRKEQREVQRKALVWALMICGWGIGVPLYIICAIILPEE